jgi:adenylate cyclase
VPAKKEMPDPIKRSSAKAQRTWAKAHDSAVEQYGEGERAHRTAFSALKHSFEKVGDHWEPKEEKGPSDPRAKRSQREARAGKGETFGGVDVYGNTKEELYERAKKADLPGRSDMSKEQLLEGLHRTLEADPANAQAHFEIGQIHMGLNEVQEAFHYFERALQLDPRNTAIKVAYAEAGMTLKDSEKISVRGKRHRIEAYVATGLRDPLQNREKVSQEFYDTYRHAVGLIPVPDDVVLPVEALDGSVGHSKVVAVISFALAELLKLSELDKLDVLQAGFLADVGKQIAPYHLLNRKGVLSAGEIDVVRMHPMESSKIIRNMGYDNEGLIEIVMHSHENFNGTGYPNGLRGEKIPLGSRIVAVADAYDALTSWRPYREPWERHAALDEIRRGAEKGLYDPKVVETLAKLVA